MEIKEIIRDKTVLVTGGTGSFGNKIVDYLIPMNPKEIRILSRDEYKQYNMEIKYQNTKNITFIIGDIRDIDAVSRAMRGVDIVYNAAAMKHVTRCEGHVFEAVMTNIVGAQNVIDAAIKENVEKVISISTDKAVDPINAMGMTKALQEKIMMIANLRKGNKKTILASVRYGNVLGSRGSVVPLFRKQILEGKSITITDPGMTRFFLSLNDAIKLVFDATARAKGGEIFVKKMPSAYITDLAKAMSLGLGKPNLSIEVIGPYPGEKKHEVLVSKSEIGRAIEEDGCFIILPALKIPGVYESYNLSKLSKLQEYTSDRTKILNIEEISEMVKKEGWFKNPLPPEIIL